MKHRDILEKIGKRMPYTVPEGSHEALRARILSATHSRRPVAKRVVIWCGAAVVAAVVTLAVILSAPREVPTESFDQMLAQLTDEECNAFVLSYSNDIFLSMIDE